MRGAAGAGGPIALLHAASSTARAGASLRTTVLPSHETHGLRKVVGELRQLGGTVGQLGNGLELLGRRRCHGLSLRSRRLGARPRLLEGRGDASRQVREDRKSVV